MFHRVKSEGQDQQSMETGSPAVARPEARGDATPLRSMQNNQPAVVRANSESQTQKQQQPVKQPETKDSQTMSEQDNQQNEQNAAATEERDLPMSGYQRMGQPPVRAGVNAYPGTYPGYGMKPHQSSEHGVSMGAQSSDRRLTIGSGITLSGEIESCDYLLVEGTVEAALKGANVLDIAESGVFYGTVEIGEANIAGRFEGDISVQGRLTISSTGTVTGSISYKELEIEAGAVIDGRVTPLSASPSAAKKPSANKAKSGKDSKPDNASSPASSSNSGAASSSANSASANASNSEGELFSKASVAAE
ncbi:MAG: polymer-forming cytoskeletal protein [Alphaproteobacteria bacterium]|nr:polymer-forming cytoskeletal protein [Alphaproteobacteria bacterium]